MRPGPLRVEAVRPVAEALSAFAARGHPTRGSLSGRSSTMNLPPLTRLPLSIFSRAGAPGLDEGAKNWRLMPHWGRFDEVVKAINIASVLRIDSGGNSRKKGTNVWPGGSRQPTQFAQLALAQFDIFWRQWPLTREPKAEVTKCATDDL